MNYKTSITSILQFLLIVHINQRCQTHFFIFKQKSDRWHFLSFHIGVAVTAVKSSIQHKYYKI